MFGILNNLKRKLSSTFVEDKNQRSCKTSSSVKGVGCFESKFTDEFSPSSSHPKCSAL